MERRAVTRGGGAGFVLAFAIACGGCGGTEEPEPSAPAKPDVKAFMTHYFATFDSYVQADILALYAADVSAKISGIGELSGIAAVRDQWLVPFTSAFPDYKHTVETLTIDGDHASAAFVFQGTHKGELLGNAPTGKMLVLPIAGEYDVEQSKVTHFELEYDLSIVLDAITPSE